MTDRSPAEVDDGLVADLRLLCDPSAEALGNAARLTAFVQKGFEAAARIEALTGEVERHSAERADWEACFKRESRIASNWSTRALAAESRLATIEADTREACARIAESSRFWPNISAPDKVRIATAIRAGSGGTEPMPTFKPCFTVNEEANLVEAVFEDVGYFSKPLIEGVHHWIDVHHAFDDQRTVGLTFWAYKPPPGPSDPLRDPVVDPRNSEER